MKKTVRANRLAIGISSTLLIGILSGCGSNAASPLSHNLTAHQIKQEVLAGLGRWHAVAGDVKDTVNIGGKRTTYHIRLLSNLDRGLKWIKVSGPTRTLTLQKNAEFSAWATQGSSRTIVATKLPYSMNQWRLLGGSLATLIANSQTFTAKVVNKSTAYMRMSTVLPSGQSAQCQLWFDLTTDTPMKWISQYGHTKVVELPSHFQVNAPNAYNMYASVLRSVTANSTDLVTHPSYKSVSTMYPVTMPPVSSGLLFKNYDISMANGKPKLLLSFRDEQDHPVIVTEVRGGKPFLPSRINMASMTRGTVTVKYGSMPLGGEIATWVNHHTAYTIQGSSKTVNGLLASWLGNTQPSSSVAPSS